MTNKIMFIAEDSFQERCLKVNVPNAELDAELDYWEEMYPNADVYAKEDRPVELDYLSWFVN